MEMVGEGMRIVTGGYMRNSAGKTWINPNCRVVIELEGNNKDTKLKLETQLGALEKRIFSCHWRWPAKGPLMCCINWFIQHIRM